MPSRSPRLTPGCLLTKIPGTGERAEYFIGGDVMKIKIVPLVVKATIYGGWSVNVNPTAASKNIARVGLR
jgi:hypothetical protein